MSLGKAVWTEVVSISSDMWGYHGSAEWTASPRVGLKFGDRNGALLGAAIRGPESLRAERSGRLRWLLNLSFGIYFAGISGPTG